MKLEEAFSLELRKDITAEEADRLFSNGDLTSKHLFECPEPNCHAQVTCANLDKPKRLRKRDPYFKFVSEHRTDCKIEKESDESMRHVKTTREDPEALPFILDDIVELDLSVPNRRITHDLQNSDDEKATIKRLGKPIAIDDEEVNRRRHSRKRLSGLVDAYLRRENFFLSTAEGKLSLRDFFIKVSDRQDLNEYPDEPRVFFGKAWINRTNDYFLIRFDSEMRAGELRCKPTFFIPARLVANSPHQRTSRDKLEKIALESKPLYVFIFSELPPVKSNNGEYINFKLDDLTYLYYLPWGKQLSH